MRSSISIIGSLALLAPALAASVEEIKAATACSLLKIQFPDKVTDKNSPNYAAKENTNWSTSCRLPAACFFSPANTNDVAKGLRIVTGAGAHFAVRNGGHMPNPKFASTDGSGVLFDMSGLKTLTFNSDNSILYAGTGNKGGDVQSAADSKGLYVATGLNTDVGISGLSLGGGYPLISAHTGFVCDNIAQFEVVLGNSTVVNATATQHSDLYQALRGGGNNFGIVTNFGMRTIDMRNIWYTLFALNPSDYKTWLPALAQTQVNMESDPKSAFYVVANSQQVQVALFHSEYTTSPAALAPLTSLTPLKVILPPTNGTVYALAQAMSAPGPDIVRDSNSIITKPGADYYVNIFEDLLKETPSINGTSLTIAIKPISSFAVPVGTQRASGLPNSLGTSQVAQTWFSVLAQYSDAGDATTMRAAKNSVTQYMSTQAQAAGLSLSQLFANDADASQNVMASYGASNLAKLKAVSQKYDPHQVFQTLQTGGWFVSKA